MRTQEDIEQQKAILVEKWASLTWEELQSLDKTWKHGLETLAPKMGWTTGMYFSNKDDSKKGMTLNLYPRKPSYINQCCAVGFYCLVTGKDPALLQEIEDEGEGNQLRGVSDVLELGNYDIAKMLFVMNDEWDLGFQEVGELITHVLEQRLAQ